MLEAIVLGLVQGLTEFIPVSSSGHLVLVPFVFGFGEPLGSQIAFDVAVHLGTAVAVVAYFWRDLLEIAAGTVRAVAGGSDERDRSLAKLAGLLALGTAPAAAIGFLFEDAFARVFASPAIVALLLLGTAGLLLGAEHLYRRHPEGRRGVEGVGWADALVVGLMQALAILPGISRSGATIVGGMGRGLSREAAARFSFLLSLPAIAGAAIVSLPDLEPGVPISYVIVAAVVAAASGFASIAFLLRFLRERSMRVFAAYCVAASAMSLTVYAVRS